MLTRPRLFGLTLLTLAITACGGPVTPPPASLVPTATITSGATENGTNANPLPTTVTITGTNLLGATLDFGGTGPGTNLVINAAGTMLTVTAPPNLPGRRPVVVTTPNGKVNAGTYTFRQPTPRPNVYLLSASPTSGPAVGGTTVTLAFDGNLTYNPGDPAGFTLPNVYFGAVQATGVTAPVLAIGPGPTEKYTITAVAPAGSGFADITLKCPVASCYTFSTTNSVPFQYLP
ncbi:IPT/TIG domain-containing protein [Deinococcus sp. AJ005]|uniref:IPT/TIG domain-containing protein n=1 Tax=Deinococcus sp. AJ005 TaxID=2652443 RepID=UPI00125CBAAB|nr:IPT/TIG domain-containing protein [Deinococcus sp. AJ005]QFP77772.1 hypothetical protein DAAJ005_15925 [Deinococcus sp. AJ005]